MFYLTSSVDEFSITVYPFEDNSESILTTRKVGDVTIIDSQRHPYANEKELTAEVYATQSDGCQPTTFRLDFDPRTVTEFGFDFVKV